MSQYQLPCDQCGEIIPITATMAGSQIACPSCGAEQTVPKMGAIRNLARVSDSTPGEAARNKMTSNRWSPTQGAVFTVGFLLLIAGLLGFALSYQKYANFKRDYDANIQALPDGKLPDFENLNLWENNISKLPVDALWKEWRDALRENLSDWNPTRLQDMREKMEEITVYLWAFGIVAITGLLLVGSSCFKWTR